jgi:hypothetical protein
MRSRQPAFKQSEVFTWHSEPADDRPTEFASSAVMPAYKRLSGFANSSFTEPAPYRPKRPRKLALVRLLFVSTIATLCLLFAGVGLLGLLA